MSSAEQAAYIKQLNPLEQQVLHIAASHLETSFSLVKSIGFQEWQAQQTQAQQTQAQQTQAQQTQAQQTQAQQKEQQQKEQQQKEQQKEQQTQAPPVIMKRKLIIKKKSTPAV
jgi:hypothetical protein